MTEGGRSPTGGPLAASILLALAFAFIHGMDALVARSTGRKGLYPDDAPPTTAL